MWYVSIGRTGSKRDFGIVEDMVTKRSRVED